MTTYGIRCILVLSLCIPFFYLLHVSFQKQHVQSCTVMQPDSDSFFKKQDSLFSNRCPNQPLNWTQFAARVLKPGEIWAEVRGGDKDNDGYGDFGDDFKRLLPKVFATSKSDTIRIFELGSFKGRSTIAMAQQCKELAEQHSKTCQVIAVDTWLASAEHYEVERDDIRDLYKIFLSNIKHEGLTDVVFPMRLPSTSAAHVFHCFHISADVVFVDSNHEYENVINELQMYYPLLRPNGVLIGDDFHIKTWPGVVSAVDEFSAKMNRPYSVVRNTWSLFKDDKMEKYFWDSH